MSDFKEYRSKEYLDRLFKRYVSFRSEEKKNAAPLSAHVFSSLMMFTQVMLEEPRQAFTWFVEVINPDKWIFIKVLALLVTPILLYLTYILIYRFMIRALIERIETALIFRGGFDSNKLTTNNPEEVRNSFKFDVDHQVSCARDTFEEYKKSKNKLLIYESFSYLKKSMRILDSHLMSNQIFKEMIEFNKDDVVTRYRFIEIYKASRILLSEILAEWGSEVNNPDLSVEISKIEGNLMNIQTEVSGIKTQKIK